MKTARLDALVKQLAVSVSRRTLLGLILGEQANTFFGFHDAEAKKGGGHAKHRTKKHKRKGCPPCRKKKHGTCKAKQPDGTACENGGQCQRGRCLPAVGSRPPSPPPPPPRPVVTHEFSNPTPILIPSGGVAAPYPSAIAVNGVQGTITDINVVLVGFNHTFPDDVDILLVASHIPDRNAIVMSDAGGRFDAINLNVTLDDAAAAGLPDDGQLVSGPFRPTNHPSNGEPTIDTFHDPSPNPTGNSLLSTFHGQSPNGIWQLFVQDDSGADIGSIAGGWRIVISEEVDAEGAVPERRSRRRLIPGAGSATMAAP